MSDCFSKSSSHARGEYILAEGTTDPRLLREVGDLIITPSQPKKNQHRYDLHPLILFR
jgi:hypothetical protein